jgi:hypothetical protein
VEHARSGLHLSLIDELTPRNPMAPGIGRETWAALSTAERRETNDEEEKP